LADKNQYTEEVAKMFLIVNPRSGRGKGRKILPLVLKPLRDKRIPHDWTFTQEPGEATELAYQAFRRGFDGDYRVLARFGTTDVRSGAKSRPLFGHG